jgi:hypothetical protein
MSRSATIITVLGLIAGGVVAGKPAAAATPVAGYIGSAPSSVAGCPYIEWKLARHSNGEVTGIVYYSDMSGVSMANGTAQGGQFQITLTSSMGNGPVGTVTGSRSSNGAITATLKGQGCANMHMSVNPVADLNQYHESNK